MNISVLVLKKQKNCIEHKKDEMRVLCVYFNV